jgi:hypothetical protein
MQSMFFSTHRQLSAKAFFDNATARILNGGKLGQRMELNGSE